MRTRTDVAKSLPVIVTPGGRWSFRRLGHRGRRGQAGEHGRGAQDGRRPTALRRAPSGAGRRRGRPRRRRRGGTGFWPPGRPGRRTVPSLTSRVTPKLVSNSRDQAPTSSTARSVPVRATTPRVTAATGENRRARPRPRPVAPPEGDQQPRQAADPRPDGDQMEPLHPDREPRHGRGVGVAGQGPLQHDGRRADARPPPAPPAGRRLAQHTASHVTPTATAWAHSLWPVDDSRSWPGWSGGRPLVGDGEDQAQGGRRPRPVQHPHREDGRLGDHQPRPPPPRATARRPRRTATARRSRRRSATRTPVGAPGAPPRPRHADPKATDADRGVAVEVDVVRHVTV